MARRIIWFSTKGGILGATLYYTNEIGIWGNSRQTTGLLEDVKQYIAPYTDENVPSFKAQVESLPSMAEVTASTKSYWNKGVLNTTLFLSNLPSKVVNLSKCGVEYVSQQLKQAEGTKEEN